MRGRMVSWMASCSRLRVVTNNFNEQHKEYFRFCLKFKGELFQKEEYYTCGSQSEWEYWSVG